jgi:hypothetical protein
VWSSGGWRVIRREVRLEVRREALRESRQVRGQ